MKRTGSGMCAKKRSESPDSVSENRALHSALQRHCMSTKEGLGTVELSTWVKED